MAGLENFVQNGKKCIGIAANYHSMLKVKNLTKPTTPGIFIKPTTSYIVEGQKITIPKGFMNVIEEIELGVIIGRKCQQVSEGDAMNYVGGYCAALDMTALCQMAAGGCWSLGKGFDTACPVSKFIPKEEIPDPHNVNLWLKINGVEHQNESTSGLVFNIPYLISYVSNYFTLEPGDLIITGSPSGVQNVRKGDIIEGGIANIVKFRFEVD